MGKEVELLMQAAGGFGIDEVVDMAVMSLPEDAFKEGTWTHNQLQEKASSLQHLDRPEVLIFRESCQGAPQITKTTVASICM